MVDILQAEGISRYYHVAWADDANGLNFSLTEYDGAVMIGTYNDDSGTESTDPAAYTWQIIGAAESGDGDPATAAAENEINALTAAVDDLTAKTLTNAGDIDNVNDSSVEGIGQPNLLSGTNRGADGWTGSGYTLAAETGTVYNETDTPITWLKATCVTPGALSFTADGLRAILANDSDTDTYTLSFDMRQSVLVDVNISMSDADGTNTQIDFGAADNASEILDDLHDMAGTWVHHALTAQIVDGNTESAQVLLFNCSAMTAGDTIEIANLKVEGGATDTPWKASAEEAMNAAEAAQATADIKKRVFTSQPVPPYNVGDLWVDLGSADYDLVTSAGDVLVDDQANALIAAVLGTGSETVVYVSTFARTAEEAYTESDWTLAATDDAKVDELREWFWHDALGAHVLGDATGYRNDITSTGMQIIDTSTETSVAIFGASGSQIGQSGAAHSVIDANGQRFYASNGTTQLANIGYGQAKEEGGTYSTNPYYTLGYRVTGVGVGAYSVAEGYETQAMGAYSHAEGWGGSDAQTAGGVASHAEGKQNYAAGDMSHVEGAYNIAYGQAAHVGGENNVANYDDQTVIGYYNDNNQLNAFEIGNGTANNASNALEVTWTGDLTAAGDITDGNGNVLSNKIDAATLVDYVTEQASSGDWRYRKWHSGKIEAWFEGTFSCAASTTARGALYYSTWTLSIPSAIGFSGTPNTLIGNTGDSETVIAVNGAATSATAMSGKVWRYASSSSALTITAKIYAWQN